MSSPISSSLATGSLTGRVALITGASSGIGAATARAFAAAGASLVLSGRDEKRLQAVADSITQTHGTKVATLVGDAGLEATQKALVDLALSRFGALHIAFNNAGILRPSPLEQVQAEDVDAQLSTNVKGIVYALKHQLPAIGASSTKDTWGVIINNSSTVSTRVKSGMEGMGVYSATKAAVDTLTRFGALEGAPKFVRVNAINPGSTLSEGLLSVYGSTADVVDKLSQSLQLSSYAQSVDELARFVLFVADNKTGRFFNGSTLLVDGGYGVK